MFISMKDFAQQWKNGLRDRVKKLDSAPLLHIIQVGDNDASTRYVNNKIKDCEEVGIKVELTRFDRNVSEDKLLEFMCSAQKACDGLIVQLPLPKHIDEKRVQAAIKPEVDVDGFGEGSPFQPATPFGIIKYLEMNNFIFEGKYAVILGRSDIVGKPIARMLLDRNATVTVCHSGTPETMRLELLKNADLVIAAVGCPGILDTSVLKDGAAAIDVGINFVDGKMVGDCVSNRQPTIYVSPVPGGVGLLTRCALLENVCKSAERSCTKGE
nr:MAG TPA: 5,10-methylene-tetrahydropholate dehydrogenase [Caudoviricetes sp.]